MCKGSDIEQMTKIISFFLVVKVSRLKMVNTLTLVAILYILFKLTL